TAHYLDRDLHVRPGEEHVPRLSGQGLPGRGLRPLSGGREATRLHERDRAGLLTPARSTSYSAAAYPIEGATARLRRSRTSGPIHSATRPCDLWPLQTCPEGCASSPPGSLRAPDSQRLLMP